MQWCSVVHALRRYLSRPIGAVAVAALAATAAGCSSLPSNGGLSLASAASSGATVAFESIDGPPPEVFRKLVADLNDEAGARKIAVVSRSASATYRVRGYVSALVERNKTTFAWVWDVYDADKRRALRISGEEPAAGAKRRDAKSAAGAWAAADEPVLRRMARSGMDQISGFLNASAPPAIAPEPSLLTLVSRRDDSPEGAGIFRVSGAEDPPAGSSRPQPAVMRSTDGRAAGR